MSTFYDVRLAFEPEDTVAGALAKGKLEKVLEPWCEPFQRYYLYYPSCKQHTRPSPG